MDMMFLILSAAVFFHMTYVVESSPLPGVEQVGSCKSDVFANIQITMGLSNITLKDVWLPNLTSNFLLERRVEVIVVDNCSTSSVDQDAFWGMEETLHALHLTNNALDRVPSKALEKLRRLERLVLDKNRIEILHAYAFKGLAQLDLLSLSGNRIKSIDNSAFLGGVGRMGWLSNLDLGFNELTAVPSLQLRDLTLIISLNLPNNKIESMVPGELDARSLNVRRLNLANNRIRRFSFGMLSAPWQLFELDLSGNGMGSIPASAFEGLPHLGALNLRCNRLQEIPSSALKNIRGLWSLDLTGNRICELRKNDFLTYGKSLEYLNLQDNSLSHIDPEALVPLESLRVLHLESNQLTSLANETIAPVFDTIQWLTTHDNPFHCDCNLAWLRDLMERQKSRNRSEIIQATCSTPVEQADVPLEEVPADQLVCGNSTPIPPRPGCDRSTNPQQRPSGDFFTTILQNGFLYLLTAVGARQMF